MTRLAVNPDTGELDLIGTGGGGGVTEVTASHNIHTDVVGTAVEVIGDNDITLGDLSAIAAGSNAITAATGDIAITDGSYKMPDTTDSTTGVFFKGGSRFLSGFGSDNLFVGSSSGNFTLSSISNTGIGSFSLQSLTSGSGNTALGTSCGIAINSGQFNTAMGADTFKVASTGSSNTAIGYNSLDNLTTSSNNTTIGASTGSLIDTGANNTSLGALSLSNITTGNDNIAVGYQAGNSLTLADSDNILLGNEGTAGDSGVIRIGSSASQTSAFISGVASVTPAGTTETVIIDTATGELGSTAAAGGGAWTLLAATTVTAQTEVDYNSSILGTHPVHMLVVTAYATSVDSRGLWIRVSNDNGSTFHTSNYSGNDTAQWELSGNVGSAAGESMSCVAYLYSLRNSSFYSRVSSNGTYDTTAGAPTTWTAIGNYKTAEDNDAIRVLVNTTSSPTFNAQLYLYGLVTS